ncbi:ABC transporter permease [Geobacter benzoatilyticus]|uniref:ABC transporter permease n=1 Tax=Geobacter benzoatilyticus TaxID=2815309 RepID=A0ABX7Q0S6_9BACT|nr:ABC transporter permease [Geobacter benzoatilyticus]QSV44929.1 ABC transporter permease [Geobacter benzoatilyticus]
MFDIIAVTLKGIIRDRVFHGILMVAIIFLFIPTVSSLSMRQVTELSITLSLSLISLILLLLSVFLGATSLWKDMERRYTFSVISLPHSRSAYLVGKFLGVAVFIFVTMILLGTVSMGVIWSASHIYPSERPIMWGIVAGSIVLEALKYILLVSFAFLFSTVSTSFFLPVFGTISVYLAGNASQQVYDYLNSPASQALPLFARKAALVLYYVLPNFSAFNLKVNAIYSIAVPPQGILIPLVYCVVYSSILMIVSSLIFSRREMV